MPDPNLNPDPVPMPGPEKFLSCDWGTSSFRLRLVDLRTGNPAVLAVLKNDKGIADTFEGWRTTGEERISFYRSFLQAAIKKLQRASSLSGIPIIISGMASSSIGLKELPYAPLPFDTEGEGLYWETFEATEQYPHQTLLISGVRSAEDVMRGEETQLVGCASSASTPRQEQIFIFPGTHSKHIRIKEGRVVDFSTYMTGEFFALLSKHSILSGSITAGGEPHTRLGFYQGVAASIHTNLLHQSFLVRTRQLLGRMPKEENYAYLSGLLIGAECNELAATGTPITLVSEGALLAHYSRAFKILGIMGVQTQDLDQAVIRGQAKIARFLGK